MRFTSYNAARGAAVTGAICLAASACELTGTAPAYSTNGNCPSTAATAFGWGVPNRADDFSDPSSLAGWAVYNGPGHDGNGRRTPSAVSVANGVLTITADADGNSGGMAWSPGQLHGRWEACVKSSPAAEWYHSLLLLWPDAEDWPVGGEVDFMEVVDPTRQFVDFYVHYGPDDNKYKGTMQIDATQWHSYAVEWTPRHIVTYVDGASTWEMTNPVHLPPRRMHLCIQLDYFGGDASRGGSQMVDWVRQYPSPESA
ncbi:MAG: hypothetical protein QOI29_2820 [Mycobacterium sp.]|nr:hypothetical protein [Mycobacterium sp.]